MRKSPAKSRTDNYKTESRQPDSATKSLFLIINLAHPERLLAPSMGSPVGFATLMQNCSRQFCDWQSALADYSPLMGRPEGRPKRSAFCRTGEFSLTGYHKQKRPAKADLLLFGAPGEIRTPDQVVRSHLLYPAELRVRGTALYRDLQRRSPVKGQILHPLFDKP